MVDRWFGLYAGNAILLNGVAADANREIGVPRKPTGCFPWVFRFNGVMRREVAAWTFCLTALFLGATCAEAHPVPRDQYDQFITVRFQPAEEAGKILVKVEFRLEVDPETVVLKDMRAVSDQVDLSKIRIRGDYFGEFTRIYADIYARRLFTRINKQELDWVCVHRGHTFQDAEGKPLDHLRCEFQFQATFLPLPEQENHFLLKNLNYQDHPGKIQLSFVNEANVLLKKSQTPDPRLQELPFEKRGPDEEESLRTVRLRFLAPDNKVSPATKETPKTDPSHEPKTIDKTKEKLEDTPSESGPDAKSEERSSEIRQQIHTGLGLIMGLAITSLGLFLLLQRLAGRADHFHVGGHHHHGEPNPPNHDPQTGEIDKAGNKPVKWWGLVTLGVMGGLIPCWDAIALLIFAISINEFWLALPLLLAFSGGLAGVLVLIGVMVVKFHNRLNKHWGETRIVRSLPILSALVVTLMGFWICQEVLNGPGMSTGAEEGEKSGLFRLFLESKPGMALMLLTAAGFGAVHALTPGHGKTMVAAYLVGERGTVWHAVFLGFVTTLTHTGIVLLLAASLRFL